MTSPEVVHERRRLAEPDLHTLWPAGCPTHSATIREPDVKDKRNEAEEQPHGRDPSDESHQSSKSGAGREATINAPEDHPHEHQSNYGGGGENGGANNK